MFFPFRFLAFLEEEVTELDTPFAYLHWGIVMRTIRWLKTEVCRDTSANVTCYLPELADDKNRVSAKFDNMRNALWRFQIVEGKPRLKPNHAILELGSDNRRIQQSYMNSRPICVGDFERILVPTLDSHHFWLVEIDVCHEEGNRYVKPKLFEPFHDRGYLNEAQTVLDTFVLNEQAIATLEENGYQVYKQLQFARGACKIQERGGPCGLYTLWWCLKRLWWNCNDDESMWKFPVNRRTTKNVEEFLESHIRIWLRDFVWSQDEVQITGRKKRKIK